VVQGGAVLLEPVTADPWEFQADCVEAFVASWRAQGFSPVTVENDIANFDEIRSTGDSQERIMSG
jgi:integrase/recombinase XerD